jgi:hypothetical protein
MFENFSYFAATLITTWLCFWFVKSEYTRMHSYFWPNYSEFIIERMKDFEQLFGQVPLEPCDEFEQEKCSYRYIFASESDAISSIKY